MKSGLSYAWAPEGGRAGGRRQYYNQRKLSQTSDNMEGWKAEEKRERERARRIKIRVHEMLGKSQNTVFFQWFVGREGRRSKSRLAKAAGGEPGGRSQTRNKKLHAAVTRSAFWSENVQNTPAPDQFWKLGCGKIAHFQAKMLKSWGSRTTFRETGRKTTFRREAHFQVR